MHCPLPSNRDTSHASRHSVAPSVAPNIAHSRPKRSLAVTPSKGPDVLIPLRTTDANPVKPSKKALPAVFANKAFRVETTGIEPVTSGLQSHDDRVPSDNQSRLAPNGISRCTNGCTSEPETHHEAKQPGNFAAALAMIASLPLSDAEKADAVRRLLSGG